MEFFKLSRVKFLIIGLMLIFISGCSLFQPFVDRRRNAGQTGDLLYVGRSKPAAPVVCYNSWVSEFEQIQKMADEECIKQKTGTRAEFVSEDKFSCRLLTPIYSNFQCINE